MTSRHPLARLARLAASRPWATLAVLAVLAAAGGALALGLQPSTGVDTLVGQGSSSARATAEYHRRFGDDAVVILIDERLPDLVDTDDLGRLINLEGCLGGHVPSGQKPFGTEGGPCWQLARHQPVQTVYGPGTFLNEATNQVAAQLSTRIKAGEVDAGQAAEAARQLAAKRGYGPAAQDKYAKQARELARTKYMTTLSQLAVSTGIQGLPQIDNASFINQIVFDAQRGADIPKARFSYLFPNPDAAVVQVRLKPGLSEQAKRDAVGWVRDAVSVKDPATGQDLFRLNRGTYTVTGVPVVVQDLADRVGGAMGILLAAALVVMALTLALVFRARLRLLPLLVALAAAGLTFGALRVVGATLTLATVAVLPVLIGLAVDYAVQFQSRVEEEGDVTRAAAAGAPTIATAGLATAVGFAVLALSPVPMVRGFGLVLILGVALALVCAFAGGAAVLQLTAGRRPGRLGVALVAARRGAADIVRALPGARRAAGGFAGGRRRALAYAVARPQRVLAVGVVLALAGWVADTQTSVVSDVTKLVPQDSSALRNVRTLERETGISGEIDVLVRGRDLTDPAVVKWMSAYQKGLLARFGYAESRGCQAATVCPALSLPDLFQTTATPSSGAQIRQLLAAVPRYFSQAVITPDRTRANLAFGIRLMPLAEQEKVIGIMRDRLHPPAGVDAALAGLPVEAADANAALTSPWRRLGTLLIGLLAVGAALWLVFRRLRRAVIPLIPIALATGWAALLVAPISLNPMSATLGALVIAISTEFSVLLAERYREERGRGHDMRGALHRSYRSTGAAILASGLTAIAGFGVLVLSDIALLRNFGWVTVLDLAVALIGVLLVLPAVLVLEERGELATLPRRTLAALRPRRPRRRRRTPSTA